ncbi:hypothetical protein B1813_18000 [Saccharomonospora piscinae]|uniref:SalK n=1 Tax=Saccharomonospora piscinae TaxID=687388 RepID=A0A1V8ZZX9_SACPI|nr:hypothetical protein [Saccharomonospora piscinae]OQO90313.1 hypothetical protein B1813_18000 [Saccharomonospora piscinae]TLW89729.1 hypothetical protein FFT09_22425 [Saccharomonospora piscinae]
MDRAEAQQLASRAHAALEPLHAFVYFAPEVEQSFTAAGLDSARGRYFAGRAAPLGAVGASVVTATFYNFNHRLVARHIPHAWSVVEPAELVKLRFAGAEAALRRLLGDAAASDEVTELAGLVREAAEACSPEGRPLFAGHADLGWPDGPVAALWHGATLLREHRGDGHIAALVAEGLPGLQALVSHIAQGNSFRAEAAKKLRGWTDEDWAGAEQALRERGVLGDDGGLTDEGRAMRAALEERTDHAAAGPYRAVGAEKSARIAELAKPLSRAVRKAGAFPRELFTQRS